MRDAVRNTEKWKRRRTPTQDPSTERSLPFDVCSQLIKQRKKSATLNILPLHNTVTADLIGRIYRSPEFFQVQACGNLLHFLVSQY